jgi:hypothetical protein
MKVYCTAIESAAESWKLVQALPDYQTLVGELLFREIFEQAPAAVSMYHFGEDVSVSVEGVPEAVFALPAFELHAQRVVKTLESALLMMLGENMNDLALTLQQLGARHVEYGVLPQHYRVVETALLRTLKKGLAEHWTQELRKSWAAVFKFLAKAMMAGCEHELEIIKEEQSIKERRIRMEISTKLPLEIFPMSPSSSETNDCQRWSPLCVAIPFDDSPRSLSPPNEGKARSRRSSFDTTPMIPRRSCRVVTEEIWDLDSQEESHNSRSDLSFSRRSADTILPRPTRSQSPERVLE